MNTDTWHNIFIQIGEIFYEIFFLEFCTFKEEIMKLFQNVYLNKSTI